MATQATGELQESKSENNRVFIPPSGEEIVIEQDHCILFKVSKEKKEANNLSNKNGILVTYYNLCISCFCAWF